MTDKNVYHVCLFGVSLDTGNMGVSALASSVIQLILSVRPEARIKLLRGNRSQDPQSVIINGKEIMVEIENYRLSPSAPLQKQLFWIFLLSLVQWILPFKRIKFKLIDFNPWLKTLYQSDFVGDIRGGDSFSDIYGLKRFLLGSIPSIIAILLKKKLTLLPQTYGPYNSLIAKRISYFILKNADKIYSRDKVSMNIVTDILRDNRNVYFCPDVAFSLETIQPKTYYISPPLNNNKSWTLIGINISGLMYNGGYTRSNMFNLKFDYKIFISMLIKSFLKNTENRILLIPHTYGLPGNVNSDSEACKEVFQVFSEKYTNQIHLVTNDYNQYEIKRIIGFSDFFIGSRMHACIAALSQGIPTIGVAYSRKFKGVFDSIGVGNLVQDARSENIEKIIENIQNKFHEREKLKINIQNQVESAKKQTLDAFTEFLHQ